MADKPIDFEAAKNRHRFREIDSDQERWEEIRRKLTEVMITANVSDTALTSATLRALFDTMMISMDLAEAKNHVVRALSGFQVK